MNRHCAERFRCRSMVFAVQNWTPSSDFQMAAFVSFDWSMRTRLVLACRRYGAPVPTRCEEGWTGRARWSLRRTRLRAARVAGAQGGVIVQT